MRLAIGSTRIVLLVGDDAVKIAYFRLIHLFLRVLLMPFASKDRRETFRRAKKYHRHFFVALVRRVLFGILMNQNEFAYFKKYNDPLVVPVRRLLFGGFINIQERGCPVTSEEIAPFIVQHDLAGVFDTRNSKNFCRLKNGHIALVDYGDSRTIRGLIMRTRRMSISSKAA